MEKITKYLNDNMSIVIVVAVVVLAIVLFVLFNYRKRKYNEYMSVIGDLDKQKVRVIYTPVELELSKLNKVVKNKDLLVILNDWNEQWDEIKAQKIGHISDKIFLIEDNVEKKKFKNVDKDIEECRTMIVELKAEAEQLHKDIIELSSIEDRVRAKVTALKADFRNVKKIFVDNEALLYYMKDELDEKLNQTVENIHNLDRVVSANEYTEAETIIVKINEEVSILRILVDRLPDLVMIIKQYIPRKIVTFEGMYKKCIDNKIYLKHLLFEDKIADVSKMIDVIVEKMKKLSFEDVEAEIDAISVYTENLFTTLEDESNNFYIFNDNYVELEEVIDDAILYVNELEIEVEKVKALYDLKDFDEDELIEFKESVEAIKVEFNELHQVPELNETYFDLLTIIDKLKVKTMELVDRIENSTTTIMSLRADEQRAREQIVEIQYLVDQSRKMMKDAKLPVVPADYRVYVADAKDGIKYIGDELDNVPIIVDDLNQRVDTSLELAYKLYNNTKKIIKESMLCEVAIIYGNRYRSNISSVDNAITKAEEFYYEGEYHDALNTVVNALEKTEPGIYSQLKKFFEKGEMINEKSLSR